MKRLILMTAALALFFGAALAQSGPDTYVYMTFGGVDTLDPEGAYDTASGTILENVYETLYTYAGTSITEFEPALATDYTVSDDGLTYTYTLRDGVTFHSGNAFSCKDVEYSLERILVMNDPQSGVWFQAEAFLGTSANANDDESITWERIDQAIECPDGPDGMTVVMTLPQPDTAFFAKLLYTNASIIDSEWAIANGEWDGTEATWRDWVGVDPREGYLHDHMSGTGAYQLVSWDGNDVIAEAYPNYWGGAPAIQTVQVRVVDEEATRILALQNGDADRIAVNSWAGVESQVRGLPGVKVWEDPSWTSTSAGAIHFLQDVVVEDNAENVGSGQLDGNGIPADFFADIDVRKGFAYSFDQNVILDELYLGKGTVLTMALPPTFLGYDEDLPVYNYDPERAEEHFRRAFGGELWDTGFEMTISYNTGNTTRQTIAEVLKANIEDLNPNFTINIRGIQWPDFLAQRNDFRFPLSVVGWAPDYADPDNFIYTFYHSNGYYGRLMRFQDPELDRLVEEARAASDNTAREFLYSQVGRRAYDYAPTLPYPSQLQYIITRENVEGVYYNPMYSHYFQWKDIVKN